MFFIENFFILECSESFYFYEAHSTLLFFQFTT